MVTESYKMSSASTDDADGYFDCSSVASMITPTVVSNFNLPNSNINKDGPYLKILEQPQTKFRFRYKSEMVGTHGQLKAESSDKNKNVFPTVQLCNWNRGPALIRLMLYTAEDNANDRKRHVHELNGKNCNKEGFTGGCEVVVDEENNYTANFPNLGIIHIAKRDVQNIIFSRKKEELVNFTCMNNPGLRNETIQHNIPPTKLQKLKEEAEEEAKTMDLNKVVLRFQTFFFDTKANFYRPVTDYVDSEVIFNLKNASTGELKIVRISAVSSPCTGGTEVWMLVEKVKKNNVRIKFYEVDRDNHEVWKGYGEFKESDVHHQYAIVFRTPAYRFTNLREPVQVKVQLERTTDNDTSEPLDFTYVPETLKRPNAYLESRVDMEVNPQKRPRHSDMEAIDLKTRPNLFLGSREFKQQPYSPEAAPYQSPPQMVPSPIAPADSPSSQGFYSPPHHSSSSHQPPSVHLGDAAPMLVSGATEAEVKAGLGHDVAHHLHLQNEPMQHMNPQYQTMFGVEGFQNGFAPAPYEADPAFFNYSSHQTLSPYHQVPSPASNGQVSPSNFESDNALTQIQQFDAVQKQVIHSKNRNNPQNWDFSDLVTSPVDHLNQNEDIDLLDIISDSKFFAAPKDLGDIQADSARTQEKLSTKGRSCEKKEAKDVDSITKKLSLVSMSQTNEREREKSDVVCGAAELSHSVAVTAADCLQSYAATGDVAILIATHRYLLAVQNHLGENSLHSAVASGDSAAFDKILRASADLFCELLVTAQNNSGETPLHMAVRLDEVEMVKRLVATKGCNVAILDSDGNTALHLAAAKPRPHALLAILSGPEPNHSIRIDNILNLYNYNGQIPLHLAVSSGCLESVKLLVRHGALVHTCERKRGANALHLAAMFGRHNIAKFLIENTGITVDAGLLDGNTALHIAVQAKDKTMCAILMSGKANPNAKNSFRKSSSDKVKEEEDSKSDSSDDDEDDDEEKVGLTPIDYAEGDEELLSILTGSLEEPGSSSDSVRQVVQNCSDSGSCESSLKMANKETRIKIIAQV